MNETEKTYNSYKKLGLPDFGKLNYEFDIGNIEELDSSFLRQIRLRLMEKVDKYVEFLEELIQPENYFVNLWEYKEIEEEDKLKLLELLRDMMYLNRQSWKMNLDDSDKENAKFITHTYNEWLRLKKDLIQIVDKVKEGWKKEITIKEKLEYLG